VLDGGHSRSEKKGFSPSRFSGAGPAPVLARYDVPEDWRFVCAIPRLQGAHGGEEKDVFERHCPIDAAEVGAVSRIILMKILPAMVERDIKSFGGGVSLLQGAGFKKLEVGLQEDVVGDLLDCLRAHTEGAGMSSFGPLCFGVASGDEKASEAEEAAREFLDAGGIESEVFVSKANNAGAKIEKS